MVSDNSQVHAREAENIADQLERVFEGDAWHGPSISEILADVSAEQAAARLVPGVHSIWEIVRHMTAWQRTVRERLQGRPVAPLPDEEDWPVSGDVLPAAWAEAVRDLRAEYELLREETSRWSGRDLGVLPEGERYTVYEMLHGVLQHGLYHAGQIAILKKTATAAPR
jgi:uncharacterized damage-inducible protein DinB